RTRAPRNLRFRGDPSDGTWKAKAGDPPELAQDNPPPRPGGSVLPAALNVIPPGLIVAVLAVLIVSQLFYAFLRYRRRAYLPILLMTAIGFGLGQLWDYLGLPSLRMGQADILPALVFALLLQPLARFVPRPERQPKEPVTPAAGGEPRTLACVSRVCGLVVRVFCQLCNFLLLACG